jgi:hypothetical protein
MGMQHITHGPKLDEISIELEGNRAIAGLLCLLEKKQKLEKAGLAR